MKRSTKPTPAMLKRNARVVAQTRGGFETVVYAVVFVRQFLPLYGPRQQVRLKALTEEWMENSSSEEWGTTVPSFDLAVEAIEAMRTRQRLTGVAGTLRSRLMQLVAETVTNYVDVQR